jgi:hypothetical protein
MTTPVSSYSNMGGGSPPKAGAAKPPTSRDPRSIVPLKLSKQMQQFFRGFPINSDGVKSVILDTDGLRSTYIFGGFDKILVSESIPSSAVMLHKRTRRLALIVNPRFVKTVMLAKLAERKHRKHPNKPRSQDFMRRRKVDDLTVVLNNTLTQIITQEFSHIWFQHLERVSKHSELMTSLVHVALLSHHMNLDLNLTTFFPAKSKQLFHAAVMFPCWIWNLSKYMTEDSLYDTVVKTKYADTESNKQYIARRCFEALKAHSPMQPKVLVKKFYEFAKAVASYEEKQAQLIERLLEMFPNMDDTPDDCGFFNPPPNQPGKGNPDDDGQPGAGQGGGGEWTSHIQEDPNGEPTAPDEDEVPDGQPTEGDPDDGDEREEPGDDGDGDEQSDPGDEEGEDQDGEGDEDSDEEGDEEEDQDGEAGDDEGDEEEEEEAEPEEQEGKPEVDDNGLPYQIDPNKEPLELGGETYLPTGESGVPPDLDEHMETIMKSIGASGKFTQAMLGDLDEAKLKRETIKAVLKVSTKSLIKYARQKLDLTLKPSPMSRTIIPNRHPVLSDLVLNNALSLGRPPQYKPIRAREDAIRRKKVRLYIDVSGSMQDAWADIVAFAIGLNKHCDLECFQFSTDIVPVTIRELKEGAINTWMGTNVDAIVADIIEHSQICDAFTVMGDRMYGGAASISKVAQPITILDIAYNTTISDAFFKPTDRCSVHFVNLDNDFELLEEGLVERG